MRRSTPPLALAAFLALVTSSLAADEPRGRPARLWDAATVATVEGVIQKVTKTEATERSRGVGLHATLKTDAETLDLIFGPAWFAEQQGLRLKAGDRLEVKGSRVSLAGKPALVAAVVKAGDTTVHLRDDQGRALWRGGGSTR
jgi:hypothetical protein